MESQSKFKNQNKNKRNASRNTSLQHSELLKDCSDYFINSFNSFVKLNVWLCDSNDDACDAMASTAIDYIKELGPIRFFRSNFLLLFIAIYLYCNKTLICS